MGQLFREQNIDTTRVNYFNQPFTIEKLTDLIAKTGLKPFEILRKGEAIAKELNLSKETSDAEIIKAIIEHPNLLQRPIVEVGEKAVLARPIEKALELIK
ncbi:MAG: ArsC/Spx/MgsR family protein [Acidobacteriota bacterium]